MNQEERSYEKLQKVSRNAACVSDDVVTCGMQQLRTWGEGTGGQTSGNVESEDARDEQAEATSMDAAEFQKKLEKDG